MDKYNVGLIGLGVMGQSLARNLHNNGFSVLGYNRSPEKTNQFLESYKSEGLDGAYSLEEFLEKLESPKKIFLVVKSGKPVDAVIEQLLPGLEEGDVLVDMGNSDYRETARRAEYLAEKGIEYVGCGMSGGEKGALVGPSLMPGGTATAWEHLEPMLQAVAAEDFNGGKCVTHVGKGGAGHYVKMVHNGIEYVIMQIMAEGYEVLSKVYGLSAGEIGDIFEELNNGKLNSFLFEIAIDVLRKNDSPEAGGTNENEFLLDKILDKAKNKGTGKLTSMDALDRGVTAPSIAEAVFARYVSSGKELRVDLEQMYKEVKIQDLKEFEVPLDEFVEIMEDAMYASVLLAFAQGLNLIAIANKEEDWGVDMAEVVRIWQGGCIIRAAFLSELKELFDKNPEVMNVLATEKFKEMLVPNIPNLKKLAAFGIEVEVTMPCITSSYNYFDAITQSKLPANFIQGLRDRFGSHTFERNDKEGVFHVVWDEELAK